MTHGCVQQIPTIDMRKHQEAFPAGTSALHGPALFLKIRMSDNADQSDDAREAREAEIEDDDAAAEEEEEE